MRHDLVALTGYGRAGKDVLGAAFVAADYRRVAFGDEIKREFDPLVQQILGFSAFTEVDEQKEQIRPLLVHGGGVFYEHFNQRFFRHVDTYLSMGLPVVNTRLFRPTEAEAWCARGGIIIEVHRKGNPPKEPVEAENLELLRAHGYINRTVYNSDDLAYWEERCAVVVAEIRRGQL